uniref:Uncharacterized protein n=1 Tax=Leersia perrieri TaxID=77586 RepID=A0A0D9XZ21_9ORYZ
MRWRWKETRRQRCRRRHIGIVFASSLPSRNPGPIGISWNFILGLYEKKACFIFVDGCSLSIIAGTGIKLS